MISMILIQYKQWLNVMFPKLPNQMLFYCDKMTSCSLQRCWCMGRCVVVFLRKRDGSLVAVFLGVPFKFTMCIMVFKIYTYKDSPFGRKIPRLVARINFGEVWYPKMWTFWTPKVDFWISPLNRPPFCD